MSHAQSFDVKLDELLPNITRNIASVFPFSDPTKRALLEPPQLSVVKGTPGVNSFCVRQDNGSKLILMGSGMYPFFHQYTRAAASYFLAKQDGGPRPSELWPAARSAMASTLEWLCVRSPTPSFREFEVTPKQRHVGKAFGDFAYRFTLCHEMAHILCGHVDSASSAVHSVQHGNTDHTALLASHQQEHAADALALELQVKSLLDPSQVETAMASAVYFVHVTGLLDGRLALLATLVDHDHWNISRTHPPALARTFVLMQAAERMVKHGGEELRKTHEALAGLDAEIYHAANVQQEETAAAVGKLLAANASDDPSAELSRAFAVSPLGVLRALEGPVSAEQQRFIETFVATLPPEFQHFRTQTPVERAATLA